MYTFEFYDKLLHITGDDDFYLLDPVINAGANQSWTVTAKILNRHPYFSEIKPLKYGFEVKKDGKLFLRGRVIEFKQDFNNTYSLYVEDKLAALNDSLCRPKEFTGTPEELFTWFIDNHNAQVSNEQKLLKGNVTVTDPNNYINRSWKNADTTWNLINSRLLDTLGGYFVVRYETDGDYLDWVSGLTDYSTQTIEFGENLTEYEKLIDADETYTACIPYGAEIVIKNYGQVNTEDPTWEADKYYTLSDGAYVLIASETDFNADIAAGTAIYEVTSTENTGQRLTVESVNDGKDYIVNAERAALYGTIYAPPSLTTWDDVTRPENLLTKATNWLNNDGVMLKETMNLSAVDLAMTGADINAFEMYKNVPIKSEPHGIDTSRLITSLKIAADLSEVAKVTLGSSQKTLSAQNIEVKKENNSTKEEVKEIKKDYVTNEKVASELSEATSQILQTAEEITMGILSGYTTTSDLEEYKKQIENLFKANEDGFAFEFSQLEQKLIQVGNEIVERNQFIRLEEGNIVIGKSDSPIQAKFTNNTLEFRYNDQTVARFTNEVLEVRNIAVDNQIRYSDDWATRPGAYVTGKGYNLNDVWIGG